MVAMKMSEHRRFYQSDRQRYVTHIMEGLESGRVKPDDFSVRDLFEAICGSEALRLIDPRRKSGGIQLFEAANAVDTSAFTNITGQIMFSKVKEAYNDPTFLWSDLCTTQQTNLLDGERIPGIGRIGDRAEQVGEGQRYPEVGLNEEYFDTAPTVKRGDILSVTKEAIIADRTGLLLKAAGELGKWMGVNKEKRVINVVTGGVNNYKRNGTAYNTYQTVSPWINSHGNTLVDWTDIENAELLFDAMTDPNTGEPIICNPNALIVPTALLRTAGRILTASEIMHVDNQANASTIRTTSTNPLKGTTYTIMSSPYVKRVTSSASTWYFGNPKDAVTYMEVWGVETTQAANNSEAEFLYDIVARYKVSERGVAQMMEPRFMTKNT
jgi:hypothetical protein